jgi:hypothetical protein
MWFAVSSMNSQVAARYFGVGKALCNIPVTHICDMDLAQWHLALEICR